MRPKMNCLLLFAIGATCAGSSSASEVPPQKPQPVAEATLQPGAAATIPRWESLEAATGPGAVEYRIAAGDTLDIMVFGHPDMRKEIPVRPDGKISYRLVGDVEAEDLTPEGLRAQLEEDLLRYMRYPQVDVIVKKAREARFTILGKVVRPGLYPIEGGTTLLDAVAMGQGLSSGQYEGSTIELADLKNAFMMRREKVVPVSFELAIRGGDPFHNIAVEDGDYIYIPSALEQEVYVLGEVFDPRAFGFRGRVTLLQATAEAGGFRSTARLRDVVVLRGLNTGDRQLIPVDVKEIVQGKADDVELQVGDVVYVPRSRLADLGDATRDILSLLLTYQSVDNLFFGN